MTIFKNIKSFNTIKKGFYVDNYFNRRKNRVGLPYGNNSSSIKENNNEDKDNFFFFFTEEKEIFDNKLDELNLKEYVKDILKKEREKVLIGNDKITLTESIRLDPKVDSNRTYFRIGNQIEHRKEVDEKDDNALLESYDKMYSEKRYDEGLFSTKPIFSILGALVYFQESHDYYTNENGDRRNVEYRKKLWDKNFLKNEYESSKIFKEKLESLGINFKKGKFDENDIKILKNWIVNSPRTEFYKYFKWGRSNNTENIIRYRFLKKYGKHLRGQGWFIEEKDQKIVASSRDNIYNLCNQIEFSVDELLGKDKDKLFINNPNVKFINFEENDWEGCSYNYSNKSIDITEGFIAYTRRVKKNKYHTTSVREKIFCSSFLHELGHSTEDFVIKKDPKDFYDFGEHLGFSEENSKYTVYGNPIIGTEEDTKVKGDTFYIRIARDKQKELKEKLNLSEEYAPVDDKDLDEKIFLTSYSTKSTSEGYAEYFSHYLQNRKEIDKDIKQFQENPTEFLKKKNMKTWFKYDFDNAALDRENKFIAFQGKDYESIIKHNMEMFIDIKNMINKI